MAELDRIERFRAWLDRAGSRFRVRPFIIGQDPDELGFGFEEITPWIAGCIPRDRDRPIVIYASPFEDGWRATLFAHPGDASTDGFDDLLDWVNGPLAGAHILSIWVHDVPIFEWDDDGELRQVPDAFADAHGASLHAYGENHSLAPSDLQNARALDHVPVRRRPLMSEWDGIDG